MKRLILSSLAVLVSLSGVASSQELPVDLDIDYATFLFDDDSSLLEVYLSVGASSLEYEQSDGHYVADLPLDIILRPVAGSAPAGASDTPVLDETLSFQFTVADTSTLDDSQFFVDQIRTAVPPGEYSLDVIAPATETRSELRVVYDVTVPDYVDSGVIVSGITLASVIRRAEPEDSNSPFGKNGLVVTPNPNALYGMANGRLFYYVENYGLSSSAGEGEYTLFAYISESNLPQPMPEFQERSVRQVRDPDVIAGAFNVSQLPSGSYFLRVALLDENNEALAEQSKKFWIFNPNVQREVAVVDAGFESSLYAVMSEEEVEENLEHAEIIASQNERSQMGNLETLDQKRQFLARFWQVRDTDSDPSVNAARREFYERLRFAEERYSSPFDEAYRTDRGRVVLKYGYPSSVDPRPFDSEMVPHEIWTYDNLPGQGAAIFVFADREGLSRYDLIHSNVTGEVSQGNWEALLRR
ncbi:MAG: GWxTD domain-containing protein [Rubricoccaceae bacterium]|nr:GWxTD domain-containing protein [Rubricoccaceae bacterium]